MSNIDIIRAWKDEEYRDSLSKSQLSQLPENPAGLVELSDEVAQELAGGRSTRGYLYKGDKGDTKGFFCGRGLSLVICRNRFRAKRWNSM